MNKNPCLDCPADQRDYNSRKCMACRKRIDYVAAIGDMTHPMPVELSDLANKFEGDVDMPEKQDAHRDRRSWTQEEKEFLRLNHKKMTYKEMAEALGRTESQIGNALWRFKIKSSSPESTLQDRRHLPVETDESNNDYFLLDFNDHQKLYERLISDARENFRNPNQHALFLIQQGLNREK